MEHVALSLIFWYGILHAFGADHLTAIADFSIGKNKRKTILITSMFAVGHGISLFIFAKILETYKISDEILAYGDVISASVIPSSCNTSFFLSNKRVICSAVAKLINSSAVNPIFVRFLPLIMSPPFK